jgi:proteasome lid subunit RPN8/RPN11
MTGTVESSKFATWSTPGHDLRIEYSGVVLGEIRETAVEGYHSVPHGGVETGGILFGTHQKTLVCIQAWRPIACEYASGPSFALSEKDEAALADALEAFHGDAELAGMEPVGWYRSHTRSEILLSDADLTFFNRFFAQPWQVCLIVRPGSFTATRAGFFFREADGGIRAQSSYREFTLATGAGAGAGTAPAAPAAASEDPPVAAALPFEPHSLPEPKPDQPLRRAGGRRKWYAASLIVLAGAVLGLWLLVFSHRGLTLFATDMGGQLRIVWDRGARAIDHATGGSIVIEDHGVRTQVNLTAADLHSGSIFYARQSGDVAVRLTVYEPGSPPIAETTRFLLPGGNAPPPAPRQDAAKQPETPRQAETEQARVAPAPSKTPAGPLPPPAPAASARPVKPFAAPAVGPRHSTTDVASIALPSIENMPTAPPPGFTAVLGAAPHPAAAPARPAAAAPAAAIPTVTIPAVARGRLIWTGKLAKNGRLVVERNHASPGAISGALPAVAMRVSAYPGDLTASGLTVFTADPRYSPPLTEKAGAENGWNPTIYTWEPKRAAGVRVLQQPSPQNGYKLVLESEIPKLSVVVLEWRATQ